MKEPFSVTGHRPNKLYDAYPERKGFNLLVEFSSYVLQNYIEEIREVGTGMAIGFDIAIAQSCIDLNIPFVACVPFAGQECNWPVNTQRYYKQLLSKAAQVVYVCDPGYNAYKMQKRNEFMVDNSRKQIALWDGSKGGTCNAVKYAKSKGVEVINVWELYLKCLEYYKIKL